MTHDDIDRVRDNMRERGIATRDIDALVALARVGLRAEHERCGACRDFATRVLVAGPETSCARYRELREPGDGCSKWRAKEGAP